MIFLIINIIKIFFSKNKYIDKSTLLLRLMELARELKHG